MEDLKKKMTVIDLRNNFEKAFKDLKAQKLISNKNKITAKGIFKLEQMQEAMNQ